MLIDEEQPERAEEISEETEEETGELVIDQLRLLLDVTKLWRRILHNEATLEELKSKSLTRAARRRVKTKAEAKSEKKTKRQERGKKSRSRKEPAEVNEGS